MKRTTLVIASRRALIIAALFGLAEIYAAKAFTPVGTSSVGQCCEVYYGCLIPCTKNASGYIQEVPNGYNACGTTTNWQNIGDICDSTATENALCGTLYYYNSYLSNCPRGGDATFDLIWAAGCADGDACWQIIV